jgi:tetratricopeptide (TPR) repeat protein
VADRDAVTQRVRRQVFLRANGRCEFGSCQKVSAHIQENGSVAAVGNFSHILPVGDGPRFDFKQQFPDVDLNAANNIMLLCLEHHKSVDNTPAAYPPDLLFQMVRRKSEHTSRVIDDSYISNPFEFEVQELLDDIRIGKLFALLYESQLAGPKRGRELLNKADSLLRNIIQNPFVIISNDTVELIRLQILIRRCANTHSADAWRIALGHATRGLKKISRAQIFSSAIVLSMTFIRDEYNVFEDQDRLQFAKLLLDRLDPFIVCEQDQKFLSQLLAIKAALLRWQGRALRSKAKGNSYSEAERCAKLSIEKSSSPAGLMQLSLAKFAQARILPLSETEKYKQLIGDATSILWSSELAEYPPAIKHRPLFCRDIYDFEKSLDCFWSAIDYGYSADMSRTAFVLGECAVYARTPNRSILLEKTLQFVHEAIILGYNHGRNFMSWIMCRSIIDPEWFQKNILAKFRPDAKLADLIKILHDESVRYFGTDAFSEDVLFGIDDSEFWNMLGRLSRSAAGDLDAAISFYERAERHHGSPAGNFTTRIGFVRTYIQRQQLDEAMRYFKRAISIAHAYQAPTIADLENRFKEASVTNTAGLVR